MEEETEGEGNIIDLTQGQGKSNNTNITSFSKTKSYKKIQKDNKNKKQNKDMNLDLDLVGAPEVLGQKIDGTFARPTLFLDSDGQSVSKRSKKPKAKAVSPPTIGGMFVDQTPGGVFAKKLQEVEDSLGTASGYRIRMVELSSTQLGRLLPNTNPWSGMNCDRPNCYTCDQGGEVL